MAILNPLVRDLLDTFIDTPLSWLVAAVETRIDTELDRPSEDADEAASASWQLGLADRVVAGFLKREIVLWTENRRLASELAHPITSMTISADDQTADRSREDLLDVRRGPVLETLLRAWEAGARDIRTRFDGQSFGPR